MRKTTLDRALPLSHIYRSLTRPWSGWTVTTHQTKSQQLPGVGQSIRAGLLLNIKWYTNTPSRSQWSQCSTGEPKWGTKPPSVEAKWPTRHFCLIDEGSFGRVSVVPLPQTLTDNTRGKKPPSELTAPYTLKTVRRRPKAWRLTAVWFHKSAGTYTWVYISKIKVRD